MRGGKRCLGHSGVPVLNNFGRSFPIDTEVLWSPGAEAVNIAIAHAKDCGNQNRIVNLQITCPQIASFSDILSRHMFPTKLNFTSNLQQGPKLG